MAGYQKYIQYAKDLQVDFEYKLKQFWQLFSLTLDRILGQYVELKTKKFIQKKLKPNELQAWQDDRNYQKYVMIQARRNFGDNPFNEIFKIKTTALGNKHSKLVAHFYENIGNYPALDAAYNALGHFKINNQTIWPEIMDGPADLIAKFYFHREQGQAVRNRGRLVKNLFLRYAQPGTTLSIACGSGQPLILALHELIQGAHFDYNLWLTDMDETSLKRAQQLIELTQLEDYARVQKLHLDNLVSATQDTAISNIEACGIFEYCDDQTIIKTLSWALQKLQPRGRMIISGMNRTFSAHVLEKLFNWHIIYRTPEKYMKLVNQAIIQAGLAHQIRYSIFMEPWGVHYIFLIRKL